MLRSVKRFITPPVFADEDKTRTARTLNAVLVLVFIVVGLYLIITVVFGDDIYSIILTAATALLTIGMWILMRRGHVQWAGALLSLVLMINVTLAVYINGTIRAPITSAYLLSIAIAGLFVSTWAAFGMVALSAAALAALLQVELNGQLPAHSMGVGPIQLATFLGIFTIVAALLSLATRNAGESLNRARRRERELQAVRATLEQRVAERTAELSQASANLHRRVNQLEASSEVSRAATTLLDPDQLIAQVIQLIQERFGFYYVGLFLLDTDNRFAMLQAGTGQAGREMKERAYRLQVGGQSMVGWVCANKQARIAMDIGDEPVRFANPLLPDTRSEMAVPLRVGERVLGALDIQSTQTAAFDETDIVILQSLADQVAVALENARLFQQTQQALKELDEASRLLTRQGWQDYVGAAQEARSAEFRSTGTQSAQPSDSTLVLRVPLELRDQPIGTLEMERDESNRPWSNDEADTIRAIAQQAVLAVENARLFEEAQGRAARERVLREISDRMQRAADMETLMRITVEELNKSLGGSRAYVRLGTEALQLSDGGK
jgi:GAF domain-containing protein